MIMARKVFFSFHFDNDFWRTQQVRNINALEGQSLITANAWEEVKKKGDASVEKWIADNMYGKSCIVVLVGSQTAERKWVRHEISKAWNNPFGRISFTVKDKTLEGIAPLKTPAGADSKAVYASIADNIETWIEEAIKVRANN
jgi:hypothetical protein